MALEDISKLKIEKTSGSAGRGVKRRNLRRIAFAVVVVVLAVLFARRALSPVVSVKVATISLSYPSQAFTLLNASGYVVAQRKAAVASKTTGRLIWIGVEEGTHVREGEIIARLENEDVLAAKRQAEANLNVARAESDQAMAELENAAVSLKREKELVSKGYTAKADYDAVEARYKKAKAAMDRAESAIKAGKAALEGANAALEYTLIRAPFDAVVLTKNADIGDIITPLGAAANAKAAVVTIADMGSLQVEADVSESNIEQIKRGQPCELQLDALPESRLRGEVHMIVPTADRTKATVMVKVGFLAKDRRILPEMSAKVAFLSRPVADAEQKPRITINPDALRVRNGRQVAFVIRKDRAVETPVVTGSKLGDAVEVTSGVKPGDRVVLNPPEKLKNGNDIRIEEK